MTTHCRVCGAETAQDDPKAHGRITKGICATCTLKVSGSSDNRLFLESIDAPVLLMQGNPRQVITANGKALELFGKKLQEVEAHRGGEVFDCIHSFTEAGCGKDSHCEGCRIKDAIVDTFTTAAPHNGVSTELSIRKTSGTQTCVLQVSTQRVGELALVRIERYGADA